MPECANKIANKKWGALTAIRFSEAKKNGQHWVFRCDCSTERVYRLSMVKVGRIDSCGCRPAPLAKRAYQISWYFGIDGDEALKLAIRTEGNCDACGKPERSKTRGGLVRMLNVDHCHNTGDVRGVLCSDCNIAIGHAEDNPTRLRVLAAYLERAVFKREI